jgi:hypothetical protein
MSTKPADQDLHRRLQHWVADGLLEAEQAGRIEQAEGERARSRVEDRRLPPGRAALIVEALGYLGGALTILAGFLAVNLLWPGIPLGAQLAFAATATVALGIAGAAIRVGDEPAFGRLRSVLWMMSTACLAAFLGLLGDQVWHLRPITTVALAAATTTAYAAVLWWRSRGWLQHLVTFAAAATAVGTLIARLATDATSWAPGLAIWLLSTAWGLAVYRVGLRPPRAGYLATVVGALFGAQMTMAVAAGHVLALSTVAGLLIGGVLLRRFGLLAAGAVGVVAIVPQTAVRYLPQSMGAPLALLAVGLVLVTVALWLARRWRRPNEGGPTPVAR